MNYKKRLFFIGGLIILGLIIFKARFFILVDSTGQSAVDHDFKEPVLGIFDRSGSLSNYPVDSLAHLCITLDKSANRDTLQKLAAAMASLHDVMITIKMQSGAKDCVLKEVAKGEFDEILKLFGEVIARHQQPVFVRWNPEMEVPVQLYAWQYQSPDDYIEAFKHFSGICKKYSPNVSVVWGPAGYPGTEEYWPGKEAVDLVSVTSGSKSEGLATAYPIERDLKTSIKRKIHRVRFMDKPVLILGAEKQDPLSKTAIARALMEIKNDAPTIYGTAEMDESGRLPFLASKPVIGVYDPKLLLVSSPAVRTEHIFIDLQHIQEGTFQKDFEAVIKRDHDIIVSFEPWGDQKVRKDTNVLLNTIQGIYDKEFEEFYRILASSKRTVYLRFAHEMEIPIHRYAWQSQDPVLYIKAFRYFMNFNKSDGGNIKKVWGPAGDRGSMEWWPGKDVVDFVSVAIYGLPDKNITDPTKQESFETIYNRKFNRIRLGGKPVFITEFGVKGPEDYKKRWMENAAGVIKTHKEIAGVCYFNLADNPKVWGNIPAPDWSIKRETFNHFIQTLTADKH